MNMRVSNSKFMTAKCTAAIGLVCLLVMSGCSSGLFRGSQPWQQNYPANYPSYGPTSNAGPSYLNADPNAPVGEFGSQSQPAGVTRNNQFGSGNSGGSGLKSDPFNRTTQQPVGTGTQAGFQTSQPANVGRSTSFFRSQSPQDAIQIPSTDNGLGGVRQTAAQFPEIRNSLQGDPTPSSPFQNPSINIGSPNELNPIVQPNAPSGSVTFPQNLPQELPANFADVDIFLNETSTGRINFGGAFNSDSGVVGQIVVDERNFDIARFPRNFREIVDGTAWRGAGQTFRLELVPGNEVERYLVNFSEPFLFGSRVSFSSSFYLFQRRFFDYDEERLGGRFALGYRLSPDISISAGLRLENVDIDDPRVDTSPQLNAALGDSDLFVGNISLIRDTRDHPFLPTEGNYLSLAYSQGFGEFDYSRGDIDFRTYRLIYQRPDGSGRNTLSYGTRAGFSGSQTPIFENYFAGGFSTLRGFDFRGASPLEGGVRVGGEFQWLNTLEYTFPLTADDMVKGVVFTDFGTVEENITIDRENFRVAPGFGFRVHLPAAGIGAPLAFDFAFPISDAEGDEQETFAFYIGAQR